MRSATGGLAAMLIEHARCHEQEHGEHQSAVHGEPPLGEKAAVATSEQHGHLLELSSSTPGSCGDGLDEGIAAHFEIGILVEGGAGGRQQHDRTRPPIAPAHRAAPRRPPCPACRIFSTGMAPPSVAANCIRGLADQIGFAPRGRNSGLQRLDAARLRDAAGDPVDVLEGGQRLLRRIGIGGLGVVDEGDAARRAPPAACGGQGPESSAWPRR